MVNLFFTSINPVTAALNLNYPKLQGKMILETSQMLATSLIRNNVVSPIKTFNPKHPSDLWVNLSRSNYEWSLNHLEALINIYDSKFNKPTSYLNSRLLLDIGKDRLNKLEFNNEELTNPHLAFTKESEDLKPKYGIKTGNYYIANTANDAVVAYREYLTRKSYWLTEYKFVD